MQIVLKTLVFFVILTLLGCADSAPDLDWNYWVFETANPTDDIVLVLDGEEHTLPVAISISELSGNWRVSKTSDSGVEGSMGDLVFSVRSNRGDSISWMTDLKYDLSRDPVEGFNYAVFYYESELDDVIDNWNSPSSSVILSKIEGGKLRVLDQ